jgi:hypothetical protein
MPSQMMYRAIRWHFNVGPRATLVPTRHWKGAAKIRVSMYNGSVSTLLTCAAHRIEYECKLYLHLMCNMHAD